MYLQTALRLQILGKMKSHPFLPMFLGLWLTRYGPTSPSRFYDLVHELVPGLCVPRECPLWASTCWVKSLC